MPYESRLFIKTGIVLFAVALLLGGLSKLPLLGIKPGAVLGPIASAGPAHLHVFMYGWITQIIIGVALWLFPIVDRDNPRGPTWVAYLSWATINLGLAARVVVEPWSTAYAPTTIWDWTLMASALLQTVGGLAFVAAIWPRVKTRG
jgi:hypothetical protein